MTRSIHKEIVYDHPVERVWRALTDCDALAQWLMASDFEPRAGHRFQCRHEPMPGLGFDVSPA